MQTTAASVTAWYHSDALGSVRVLSNTTGGVSNTSSYSAYGTPTFTSGSTPNTHGYAGEQIDPTGLSYNRARYYDAGIGRFTQRDTFAGRVQNPLSLNRYIYTWNNPLKYVDRFGRKPEIENGGESDSGEGQAAPSEGDGSDKGSESDEEYVYRAMKMGPDGKPVEEESARGTLARVGSDVHPDDNNNVDPKIGDKAEGLSSAETPEGLPDFRRPSWVEGGTSKDELFRAKKSQIEKQDALTIDHDGKEGGHTAITPSRPNTPLDDFQDGLRHIEWELVPKPNTTTPTTNVQSSLCAALDPSFLDKKPHIWPNPNLDTQPGNHPWPNPNLDTQPGNHSWPNPNLDTQPGNHSWPNPNLDGLTP